MYDSVGTREKRSAFTIAASIGRQDDPIRPKRVLLFRPSAVVTVPEGLNSSEFTKLDLNVSVQQPLRGRVAFWGRAAIGRLYTFGKSAPSDDEVEASEDYLRLRDDLFTAGGSGDVRGWASRLLGPKLPDFRLVDEGDTTVVRADNYLPIGGELRATLSGELRLPAPWLGESWGTHIFVDAGKVWSSDRTHVGEDEYDQERLFVSTGAGIDRDTPVGPVRISVGYMLNPSDLDVLKPKEFVEDVLAGTVGQRTVPWTRRFRVHLSIGANF